MGRFHINALGGLGRAALTVGLVAAALAVPATANADPGTGKSAGASAPLPTGSAPAGFSSWAELIRVQNRLISVAQRINTAPGAQEGLGGIVLAPEQGRMTLYWKGTLPSEISRLIRQERARARVDVRPAAYSAAELAAVAKSIAARPGVATAAGNVDGSGVTVTITDVSTADVAAVGVDVPVTVKVGTRPLATACTGRQDDCSPYWGGAMYNSACSTGFSVFHAGQNKIISAAHCADNGNTINDGGGENIGTVEGDDNGRDTLLIGHPAGTSSSGRIYAGPWDAGLGSSRRVTGAFGSFVGAFVCTSGSFTGEHCNIRVSQVNIAVNTDRGVFFPEVQADEVNGAIAVGRGDSGGPVHFLGGDGSATAAGTISALTAIVGCPVGSPSDLCGSTVFYADITLSLNNYGAAIVTG